MNRRGFTFIELLVTLILVGILVNIAVPAISLFKRRAIAARGVGV